MLISCLRGPWSWVGLWLACGLLGCGGGSSAGDWRPGSTGGIASAASGVIAVSASARLDPLPATAEQYAALADAAFELVFSAGARGQMSTWTWRELEPSAGRYDADTWRNVDNDIARARSRSLTQYVGIQIINTTTREMPAGLEDQAFDSVAVTGRFHALLDRLVGLHRGQIKYLSIGNEVDVYLRAHPDQWTAYQHFYEDAVRYAHGLDPGLKIGVTGTAGGALGQSPIQLQALNTLSDVVILTYYPLQYDSQFKVTVRDPGVVHDDFRRMLAFADVRPLVLQEVGYPASLVNDSSEDRQAAFVSQAFAEWSAARGRVPFMNFFLLHDLTPKMCDDLGIYYGSAAAPGFKEFLCSLGLRTAQGVPRAAWSTLLDEARKAKLR